MSIPPLEEVANISNRFFFPNWLEVNNRYSYTPRLINTKKVERSQVFLTLKRSGSEYFQQTANNKGGK